MGSGARDKIVSVELNAHEVALQPNGRSRGSCACSPLICILSVSLLFVTVGLLVATVFHNHDKQLKNRMKLQLERRNTTCSSSQCLRMAVGLLSNMNQESDPCDDAYNFACGGYKLGNNLGVGQSYRDMRNDLTATTLSRLYEILVYNEEFEYSKTMKQPWKKAASQFYKTCLQNLLTIDKSNVSEEINRTFMRKFQYNGDNFQDWGENAVTLAKVLATFWLNNLPIGIALEWQTSMAVNASTSYCLKLVRPVLLNNESNIVIQIYRQILNAININVNDDMLRQISDLHVNLLRYTERKPSAQKPVKRFFKWQKFTSQIDSATDERDFLPTFVRQLVDTSSEQKSLQAKLVCVRQPDELLLVLAALKNAQPQVSIAYGMANAVIMLHQAVPTLEIEKLLTNAKVRVDYQKIWHISDKEIQNKCATLLDKLFRFIIVRIYSDTFVSPATKPDIQTIYQNVKEAFKSNVRESKFSTEAKKKIVEKINAMKADISYPDWVDDDAIMNDMYKNLTQTNNNYIENFVTGLEYPNRVAIKKTLSGDLSYSFFLESVSSFSPTKVRAFYGYYNNIIGFTMGILRPPLYTPEAPLATKYGFAGYVSGHEIGHGFDPKFHKFDLNESMKLEEKILVYYSTAEHSLWNENSTDEMRYKQKIKCVEDDYGKEKIGNTNISVNGKSAAINAVPDIAGIRAAYKAFKKEIINNKVPYRHVIGMTKYSEDQMFFISSTQFHCSKYSTDGLIKKFNKKFPYPPPRLRVNGALRNTKEYAKAFNCKLGSKMNPKKKCVLW